MQTSRRGAWAILIDRTLLQNDQGFHAVAHSVTEGKPEIELV